MRVYPHLLGSTAATVEWLTGTTLTRLRSVLPDELFQRFVADYERAVLDELGDRRPFFFPFKRILFVGALEQ